MSSWKLITFLQQAHTRFYLDFSVIIGHLAISRANFDVAVAKFEFCLLRFRKRLKCECQNQPWTKLSDHR